jgi:hypothetical protein
MYLDFNLNFVLLNYEKKTHLLISTLRTNLQLIYSKLSLRPKDMTLS